MAHLQAMFSSAKCLSYVETVFLQMIWSEVHQDPGMTPSKSN